MQVKKEYKILLNNFERVGNSSLIMTLCSAVIPYYDQEDIIDTNVFSTPIGKIILHKIGFIYISFIAKNTYLIPEEMSKEKIEMLEFIGFLKNKIQDDGMKKNKIKKIEGVIRHLQKESLLEDDFFYSINPGELRHCLMDIYGNEKYAEATFQMVRNAKVGPKRVEIVRRCYNYNGKIYDN